MNHTFLYLLSPSLLSARIDYEAGNEGSVVCNKQSIRNAHAPYNILTAESNGHL